MPKNQPEKVKDPARKLRRPKFRISWLLVAGLLVFSVFMFVQYHDAKRKLQSSTSSAATKQQVSGIITKVSRLIILPNNENPTVATVVHADKLKSQTFFASAQDGDKVLVYSHSKKAFLYRPSTNQLVNVSSVSPAVSPGTAGQ